MKFPVNFELITEESRKNIFDGCHSHQSIEIYSCVPVYLLEIYIFST
jgi:hypothetical protein